MQLPKKSGFTLIELLITIAIIGILAGIGVFTSQKPQKMARDTGRKADLKQCQALLEIYANSNGNLYPSSYPSNCTAGYNYYSATGADYVMWFQLEAESTATYWVICSEGKVGTTTSQPTNACNL